MRSQILLSAFLPLFLIQPACELEDILAESDRFRETFQYNHVLKPGGVLSLENYNGSIEILSWEKDEVQIAGTKYARSERDLRDLRIETEATPDSVRIRTVRPLDRNGGGSGAKFFIRVPRRVNLERVSSTNGAVQVEGIEGEARVQSTNGALTLRRISGRIQASTTNGRITGDELASEAVLKTTNGAIQLQEVDGAVEARTTNGGIHVSLRKPALRAPLRASTTNGRIELTLETFNENEIQASTANGGITLRLPENAKARISASTSSGKIRSDFSIAAKEFSNRSLDGDLGGGGPLIRLTTSNSSIDILRH